MTTPIVPLGTCIYVFHDTAAYDSYPTATYMVHKSVAPYLHM